MFLNSKAKRSQRLLWFVTLTPILIALAFLIRMPLSWQDQAIFSGLIIACCVVVGRFSASRYVTTVLTFVSIFCTSRYAIWRWSSSISFLNNSGWKVDTIGLVFALLLLVAETYSAIILLLGYIQSARPLRRKPVPMPADVDSWPSVDVFIPTYNEPLEVVRPTVLAALGIDWPRDRMNVFILDDGRRPEFREFAEECGAGYLTRTDNAHAKAGNINAALKKTTSEYIAIFDCDHISTRSFLQLTMGWFGLDKKLALVQTPHHFYSPDPFERNLNLFRKIPNEGALFYGVVQDGNDLWNATFFCGSCAVIKREALEQIGGIAVETVTEDAHTALRLQRLGWNTAYIGIPQAAGLATGSLAAHVGQRIRWARGMVQILRTDFPLAGKGLNLAQRVCYLNCVMHYLYAIPRLIFATAPLVYLLLGRSNLYGFLWEILAYAAPHLVLSNMVNSRCQGNHRHSFWNEVYEMVLAPYILLPTTFALINPKWGKFNVTAKNSVVDENFFDWKIARPYIFLIAINIVAIVSAVPRYFTSGDPSGVLLMNVVWAFLNTLMLGACVAVSLESKQRRTTTRVEANLTATLDFADGKMQHCHVIDLSEGGLALRADSTLDYAAGQAGTAVIRAGFEEFSFAVQTVRTSENRIHLRFSANNLKHQRDITKLVYARADSWVDWTKDQKRDRILSSFVHVLSIGANGVWMLPSFLIKTGRKPANPEPSALSKAMLPLLLLGIFLGGTPHLKAQAVASEKAMAAPADQTFSDRQSFSDLGAKAAIVLEPQRLKNTLNFVLPATKIVSTADLALYLRSGETTPAEAPEIAVSLNGIEVTTVPVKDLSAHQPLKFNLPEDLLVHENSLTFELRRSCSAPCSKEESALTKGWVRVEPMSELVTSGMLLGLPNRLSMLPEPFFDRSLQRSVDLPVVLEAQPDLSTLRAAGIVASWYGSLTAHRGAHYIPFFGQFPKGNAVVVARAGSALAETLGLTEGAMVAICDNPSDKYGKVLALVAPESNQLPKLASLLGTEHLSVDTDKLVMDPGTVARIESRAATSVRWEDASHPIHLTTNLADSLLSARLNSPSKLYFRLAPDLDYGSKITVPLHLSYRLAGLAPEDHVWLALSLNNNFVLKRRLGAEDLGPDRHQSFAIPVSLLFSSNTLSIELTTDRKEATVSDPRDVELQVLPSTNLELGNPTHFVQMPRLDLFAASGFPFTLRPDLAETTVVLPEYPTAAQIGLYLDAISFLSAQSETVATSFKVVGPRDLRAGSNDNILVITGATDDESCLPFQRSMIVMPQGGKFVAGETDLSWQEWISRAWLGRRDELQRLDGLLERESSLHFLVEQFKSPFHADRSVVVLATRSETDDNAYFESLAKASREGAVSGGVALADSEHFFSFQLSTRAYVFGASKSRAAVYGWLRFHLWILPFVLLLLCAAIARWWEQLVARQALHRLELVA